MKHTRTTTKRVLSVLLAVLMVALSLPMAFGATIVDSGSCGTNVTYTLDSEGTLTISGTGAMSDYEAFVSPSWNKNNINSIVVKSGITSIGAYAFENCKNLTSISLPSSLTSIGYNAFRDCINLGTFSLPNSLTSIGSSAFLNCKSLTSISFPNKVKTIAPYAFEGCKGLTEIEVPSSITSLGVGAFSECTGITGFSVASSNTAYSSDTYGCLYNKKKTTLMGYPCGNSRTSFSIPNSVTSIDSSAFNGCASLTSISIPNSVRTIGHSAFRGCAGLTTITIPNGVTSIDSNMFFGCSSLASIVIPDSVKSFGSGAFERCSSLTSITIPSGSTEIWTSTFSDCSSLTTVLIPDGVTRIQRWAFENCTSLKTIIIPESVRIILEDSFSGCSSLKDVFYSGSESQWNEVGATNNDLSKAEIHYNFDPNDPNPIITHSVTYDYSTNGGTSATATTATVAENAAIDLTPTATKIGWTFVGWNTNANATTGLSSLPMGTSRVTLYAIYQTTFTATFIDYNGTTKTTRTSSGTAYNKGGAVITVPEENTYTGWTNRGWSTNTAPGEEYEAPAIEADTSRVSIIVGGDSPEPEEPEEPSTPLAANERRIYQDKVYYGRYQRTLTLSYNANGGSSTPGSETALQCVNSYDITVINNPSRTLAAAITKPNATFDGWAKGSPSGTKYAAGESITISENTTMYATWINDEPTTHTVTYNYSTNGGTSATKTSATVAEGSAIDLTPTATKSGWTFVGWNTNANATTALSSLNMGTSNVTLYAIFKKTLTGTFIDYSGTTKKTTTKTVDIYNNATSGTLTAPTQNTYTGWTSRGWATGTAADASAVSSYTISANTTYYGLYQRTLTLSYNANGGSSTPSSQTGTQYANSYGISSTKNPTLKLANAISKSGSTFDGWAMGSASGTKYTAGANVTISANTTMYATWTVNPPTTHTVTYNYSTNGGTSATKTSATVAEGSAIDLTPTATKSGWTFVGWNTNANATTALSSLNMGTSNVTLYAIFKKTLTGTFIDYSGTTKKTTTKTVDIYNNATSGTLTAPTQNTYTGWTSRGWATGTAADASAVSSFTVSANTTYYGLYQRTLTLSYNANGGSSTPSSQTGTQYANSYGISSTKNPTLKLANAISKSGSTFDGWAMGSASGTKYTAGANVTISANTTMYATWISAWLIDQSETYSFANNPNYFKTGTYTILDSDFNKLANYVKHYYPAADAATYINEMQSYRTSEWGGSCYGMAASAILNKKGQIDFKKHFDPDAQTLWDVDAPYQNSKVQSAVNYYLISQEIPIVQSPRFKRSNSDWKAGIKRLVQSVQNGNLTMFSFIFYNSNTGKSGGHAIVVKGCTQNADGSYNLITWDNNYPGVDESIYVTSDFSNLYIPVPDKPGYGRYGQITQFEYRNDFSVFDYIDIDGPNNDMVIKYPSYSASSSGTYLDVVLKGDVTIENAAGQTLTVTPEGITGTMPVLSERLIVTSSENGEPGPAKISIEVEDSKSYTFESSSNDIEISIRNDKIFAKAETTNADTVIIGEDEGIYMLGDNISYSTDLSLNNNFCDMVEIEGVSRGDAKVLYKDKSVEVIGAQKTQNTLTVYDNVTDVASYLFSSSYNDMLVTNNSKGDVVVLGADSSGDFTYAIMGEADARPHTHSYTSKVTKQPTCTEAGVRTYTCVNGDHSYTESIPALGHTEPDSNGNCTRCKAHIKDVVNPNACKYCGKEHTGLFGWLVKFFHNILFSIFGAKK